MCLNRAQSPNSKKILMSTIQQVVSKKVRKFFLQNFVCKLYAIQP